MREIHLRSHDGSDVVCLRIDANAIHGGADNLSAVGCYLSGLAYDRHGVAAGKPVSNRDKSDYDVRLPQIVLRPDALQKVSKAISKWKSDHEPFEVIISDANEQKMSLSLEILEDFICSSDRPVAVVRYSVHRIAIESRFVVDIPSIEEFENEVKQALATQT
jgi:hypothetical protein